MRMRAAGSAMMLVLGMGAMPATAGSFSKLVTLTPTTATYNALANGTPPASLAGVIIPYEVLAFTVDQTGSYQLGNTASGGYKPYLTIYGGGWSASTPLVNAIVANHYTPSVVYGTSLSALLSAGTTYVAVMGGEIANPSPNGNAYGNFSINGPGTITQSAVVPGVPEPASWALMVGGFGLIGTALRMSAAPGRRRSIRGANNRPAA